MNFIFKNLLILNYFVLESLPASLCVINNYLLKFLSIIVLIELPFIYNINNNFLNTMTKVLPEQNLGDHMNYLPYSVYETT